MLAEAKKTDFNRLLSTEAGLRAVTMILTAGCRDPVLAGKNDVRCETEAKGTEAADVRG